jgi:alkylated DNA repair dioxygenase AlkB
MEDMIANLFKPKERGGEGGAPRPAKTPRVEPRHADVPEGLVVLESFCDPEEQRALVERCEGERWLDDLTRLTQHYGFKYLYRERALAPAPAIPEWLGELGERAREAMGVERAPDQIIVNRYARGQGITAHVDHTDLFGPVIATLSLGATADMVFRNRATGAVHVQTLHPGSMAVLAGPARNKWTHELRNGAADVRISITFRTTTAATHRAGCTKAALKRDATLPVTPPAP